MNSDSSRSVSPIVPQQLVPEVKARTSTVVEGHRLAVQRMFDRISPTYDLLNRVMSMGVDRRWRQQALAALSARLPPGPVLDLCAGTLDLAVALERSQPERPVIAADFARHMLIEGRGKVRRAQLAQADAMALPLRPGVLAGALCGFGIRNVADPGLAIAQVYSALQSGGVFVVLEFFRPTRWTTRTFHAVYGRMLLPWMGGLLSGETAAYRYLSESMRGFFTREEFDRAMKGAGFREVYSRDLTLGIASLVVGVK